MLLPAYTNVRQAENHPVFQLFSGHRPVRIPDCLRIISAKDTWNPRFAGSVTPGTSAPLETSIRSTPVSRRLPARETDCSRSQPPGNQSVAEIRTNSGESSGIADRTGDAISRRSRVRFLRLPPYRSVNCGVLAHRRDRDAVAQGHTADRERGEQIRFLSEYHLVWIPTPPQAPVRNRRQDHPRLLFLSKRGRDCR